MAALVSRRQPHRVHVTGGRHRDRASARRRRASGRGRPRRSAADARQSRLVARRQAAGVRRRLAHSRVRARLGTRHGDRRRRDARQVRRRVPARMVARRQVDRGGRRQLALRVRRSGSGKRGAGRSRRRRCRQWQGVAAHDGPARDRDGSEPRVDFGQPTCVVRVHARRWARRLSARALVVDGAARTTDADDDGSLGVQHLTQPRRPHARVFDVSARVEPLVDPDPRGRDVGDDERARDHAQHRSHRGSERVARRDVARLHLHAERELGSVSHPDHGRLGRAAHLRFDERVRPRVVARRQGDRLSRHSRRSLSRDGRAGRRRRGAGRGGELAAR
jgi:hypothetical protein